MERNIVVRVCWIILIIILIAVLIEIGMRFTAEKVINFVENKQEEKQEQIIYNSEEAQTKREIDLFANNILDAIKENDYQYIFTLLDSTYKEYMFDNDINAMKRYIESNFIKEANYLITNIHQYGGSYHVTISEELDGVYSSKFITAVKKAKNSYGLIFGEYEYIRKNDLKYVREDIEYTIIYEYAMRDNETYVIEIKNKTAEKINLLFNEIVAISDSGRKFPCTQLEALTINNNETKRIEISVRNENIALSQIQLKTIKNNAEEDVSFLMKTGII